MEVPQTITLSAARLNGEGNPDEGSNLLSPPPAFNNNDHNLSDRALNGRRRPTTKPMGYLESRRQCHILWTVSLIVVFLGLIGSLALWRFHQQVHYPSVVDVENRADHARKVLNSGFKSQAKIMAPGCEATVLLVRHCEKSGPNSRDDEGNDHCTYVGAERAQYLKTLFGEGKRWPQPSYLFALTPDRIVRWNYREYETLHPLSLVSGVEISIIDPLHLPPKIFDLLQSGQMCGRLAVVSWKHEYIPDLATALGCGIYEGCPTEYPDFEFDQVWQLKYVFRPKLAVNMQDENNVQANTKNMESDHTLDSGRVRKLRARTDLWYVYGSLQNQGFDPLAFSYSVGDYNTAGIPSGGRWKDEV